MAFCQLVLFVVLPRKPKQQAPIVKLFNYIKRCGAPTEADIEAAAVVPPEKDVDTRLSKRWSKRLAASMASVTSEIEDAMSKVQMGGQFGYSLKLNTVEDIPSDNATLDSAVVTPLGDKPVSFPMTITSEEQLIQVSKHLLNKITEEKEKEEKEAQQADRAPFPAHFDGLQTSGSSGRLERTQSVPHLNN